MTDWLRFPEAYKITVSTYTGKNRTRPINVPQEQQLSGWETLLLFSQMRFSTQEESWSYVWFYSFYIVVAAILANWELLY